MGIFRQFPYSNFHEMNMDEILNIVKTMDEEWEATKTEWASYKEFIDNYFNNLDVSEEVLEALRAMASSGELNQIMDPTIATETAAWLAEHITPTTPALDNTLTVAGAAAEAKAAGDLMALKTPINGNISESNYQQYFTDADNAIGGTAYVLTAAITKNMIANLPRYGNNGVLITLSGKQNRLNVLLQLYVVRNTVYHRISDYTGNYNAWKTSSSARGYVTTSNYTDYFTDANNAQLNSVYIIQATMDESNIANLPEYHMTTQANLITLCGLNDNEGSGNAIQFFAVGNGGAIYYRSSDYNRTNWSKWEKIVKQPKIFRVGPDKEYTTLTAAMNATAFGSDAEQIILVDGGVYDIFQEYVANNVPVPPTPTQDPSFNPSTNYVSYNVWVNKNVHIIGQGNVILKCMPEPADLNYNENWSKVISPLNVREGCTIENIEIWAKNCRYCIHDDYNYVAATADAIKHYNNVICRRFERTAGTNYGWREVIGIGAGKRQRTEFHNCKFYSEYNNAANFYIHNRNETYIDSSNTAPLTEYECSRYILDQCLIAQPGTYNAVLKLANEATTNAQHIYFDMLSTYVSGGMLICDIASESAGNNANSFDVTQLMCNVITNTVRDGSNPYPVKVYR